MWIVVEYYFLIMVSVMVLLIIYNNIYNIIKPLDVLFTIEWSDKDY